MGKHLYRKQNSTIRELCYSCGENLQKSKGNGKYKPICSPCDKKKYTTVQSKQKALQYNKQYQRPYTKYKKDSCECCGFIPIHPCQLDVDHIDGNHQNSSVENLQTLCANCHRLKTFLNKDWEKK